MTVTLADLAGVLGAVVVLVAYASTQVDSMRIGALAYSVLNLIGTALILVSLTQSFNLPAFLLEIAWGAISLHGLIRAWPRRDGPSTPTA